jgi:hypothetical protein
MTVFELLNLDLCLGFGVIHRLADVLPALGGHLGSGLLVRFVDLLRGVRLLSVAFDLDFDVDFDS